MPNYIDYLRMLNRKERFYLVGFALDNRGFQLGDEFRDVIRQSLGVDVPGDAFVAMDYHISWLYAAAVLARDGGRGPFPGGGGIERGNQEDVDLVIAYEDGEKTRVLVLEAKGVTGWSNKQLRSKVDRLRMIFGDAETTGSFPFLEPRFAILSPLPTRGVTTAGWPAWMLDDKGSVPWVRMPAPNTLLKVTRCDERGATSAAQVLTGKLSQTLSRPVSVMCRASHRLMRTDTMTRGCCIGKAVLARRAQRRCGCSITTDTTRA